MGGCGCGHRGRGGRPAEEHRPHALPCLLPSPSLGRTLSAASSAAPASGAGRGMGRRMRLVTLSVSAAKSYCAGDLRRRRGGKGWWGTERGGVHMPGLRHPGTLSLSSRLRCCSRPSPLHLPKVDGGVVGRRGPGDGGQHAHQRGEVADGACMTRAAAGLKRGRSRGKRHTAGCVLEPGAAAGGAAAGGAGARGHRRVAPAHLRSPTPPPRSAR